MANRLAALAPLFVAPFILASGLARADVAVERTKSGAVVTLDGQPFAEYLVRSGSKPVVWPLIGPMGKPLTRHYPMASAAGESSDHPHHRSLWFSHGQVNGVDFWLEGKNRGTIEHLEFAEINGGETATIATRNSWKAPDGKEICQDRRRLIFGGGDDARWIDFTITIVASNGPVSFGRTKEGTFGLRMAATMRADKNGKIVNSEGQTDKAAWRQQAAWVDYSGPIDDETFGVAVFNHPSSFRFPTYWHVRTYGLFAANPFGVHYFEKKPAGTGNLVIPAGESVTFKWRFYFHKGDEKQGQVAEHYRQYAS